MQSIANLPAYLPAPRRIRRRGNPAIATAGVYSGPAIVARQRAARAIGRASLVFLAGTGFGLAAALPLKAHAAPYGSAPITLPATLQAEHFDKGGEGVGYHDKSAGNAGGQFRPDDGVDIIAITGGHAVNNFQSGEWLAYTVKVPAAGDYFIELRASTTYTNSLYHAEIDGADVTGPVSIPVTGGWNSYQWVGRKAVTLPAGSHVLRIRADRQYFNLDAIRVTEASSASAKAAVSTPYSGTPFSLPGTIQAERFNLGGEGLGYHDRASGNAGKAFRTSEDVDIVPHSGGGYVVNNFQTGEWLRYWVNVTETGEYDIALNAASAQSNSAFHVQIDGTDVTGSVPVPNTGGWNQFNWVTKERVTLQAGKRMLKVVSDQQYFNLNSIRVTKSGSAQNPPNPQPGNRKFFCTFGSSPGECGFSIQAKASSRVSIVSGGRDGGTAVRLRTLPGDDNVFGSGSSERADLSLSQGQTDCSQGKEAWWAHSIKFPSDYVPAADGFGVVMDFHHDYPTGQANFHLDSSRWDGKLHFRGYGGSTIDGGEYQKTIGPIVKNQWYDFVYHVRWSSGSDGFMRAWVNGVKKLDHSGPTLYSGIGCYLKLANYHSPFGQASAVIHDRVIRGTTWQSVSDTALEGVN